MTIEQGQQAPDFELASESGERVRLSDLRGKPVVLYFYPRDEREKSARPVQTSAR